MTQEGAKARQLTLNIRLRDGSSFANFLPARNLEAFDRLQAFVKEAAAPHLSPLIYLWGESGAGKTHLLEAACRQASEQGLTSLLLPLRAASALRPEALDELEHARLICLDDLESVAGQHAWESRLFALLERAKAAGALLLAAAAANPRHLGLVMPELRSRLGNGWVYRLHVLDDAEKSAALRLRAQGRGLEIPDDVAGYILTHHARDMHTLFDLLERLDRAALAAKRRLTIPFVRELA